MECNPNDAWELEGSLVVVAKAKQKKGRSSKTTGKGPGRPRSADQGIPTEIALAKVALQEFAAQGYEGAKIANIAKLAGVVTPAVHYHYQTKLDLWKAAVDYSFKDFDALTESFQSGLQDLDPLSALKVMVRRYTTVAFQNPWRIRILLLEGLRDNERSRWMVKKHLLPFHEDAKSLFENWQSSGIIKPYSALTVLSMLGGAVITIMSNTHMVGDVYGIDELNEEELSEISDAIIDILFSGILAK